MNYEINNMKLLTSLFLLLFTSSLLYAQEDSTVVYLNGKGLTLDSVKQVIADKSIKFEKKFELIKTITYGPPDLVLDNIYLKLLPEAKKQDDKTALVFLYSGITNMYIAKFEYDKSKLYLDSAALYVPKTKDTLTLGSYYYYLGTYYHLKDSIPEAFSNYNKALSYCKTSKQIGVKTTILTNMAVEYINRNDEESVWKIIENLEQSATIKPIRQNSRLGYDLNYLKMQAYQILYVESNDKIYLDSIIKYAMYQIPVAKKMHDRRASEVYLLLADAEINKSDFIDSDDYKRLNNYIQEADSMVSGQDKELLARSQQIKAELFYTMKQYDKAEKEALKGLDYLSEIDKDTNTKITWAYLYNLLAQIYEVKHDYKKALEYEKLNNKILAEINKAKQYEIIKNMEVKYETEKKELVIQELNNKNGAQKKIQILYLAIIGLLIVALFLFARWIRNRRKIFATQLEITRLKSEESEREIDQMKHRAVQAKFIPHFTGNVLNSINYLILKNPDLAQKYISKFSDFSKQTLLNSDRLQRTIGEELEYAQLYLELEKLRFQEKLEYGISVAPEADTQKMIPTMILQTFCENAVKHGLRPKEEGGKITIYVYPKEEYTVLAVEDTGIGREKAEQNNTAGTREGLNIVQQQLDLFNKNQTKEAYLQIVDLFDDAGEASGTRFELYV